MDEQELTNILNRSFEESLNCASPETKEVAIKLLDILRQSFALHVHKQNHHRSQFIEDGEIGVIIRLKDKINDIKGGGKPTNLLANKKLEDWLDVVNYATQGTFLNSI